jgi:hydrogenase maturation protease
MKNKVLILGFGNPIMSDDNTGLIVAKAVFDNLIKDCMQDYFEIAESSLSGWRILDVISGYDSVIMIDSLYSETEVPGTLYEVKGQNDIGKTSFSSHGAGIFKMLSAARESDPDLPKEIKVYAVTVNNSYEFGEKPGEEIRKKIPDIARQIYLDIKEGFYARMGPC